MNILLWVLQGLLAFWNLTGGIFSAMNYEKLKSSMASGLPSPFWVMLGVLQALFAVGLVVPGAVGLSPKFTLASAVYLTVNSLLGLMLFAKYAGFPGMLWGLVPAIITAYIAYGRWT